MLDEAMGTSIGIDLGTSKCVVAVDHTQDDRVQVITNETGHASIASVLTESPDGTIVVGDTSTGHPSIKSVKRWIGRGKVFDLPRHGAVTAEEATSLLLSELRKLAERQLGESVSDAVIGIPQSWPIESQMHLREAANKAGLNNVTLLPEPIAAVVAADLGDDARRVLTYDLGGGKFEASVVQIRDGNCEVIGCNGDRQVSGDDFDSRLASHLWQRLRDDGNDLPDAPAEPDNNVVLERLLAEAERTKRLLSVAERSGVRIAGLAHDRNGAPLALDATVTRQEFEEMIASDVERTMSLCDEVLNDAQLTADDIDDVLPLGGCTRIPLVRRRLEETFGPKIRSVDPDTSIAVGAAKIGRTEDSSSFAPILQHAIDIRYTDTANGFQMAEVFPSGTNLPATYRFPTLIDLGNDARSSLALYQLEAEIGVMQFEDPIELHGPSQAELTIRVSADVEITATIGFPSIGHIQQVKLTSHTNRSPVGSNPPNRETASLATPLESQKIDENVQFTVYRPKAVRPEQWYTMLAFAHLDDRPEDASENQPHPEEVVRQLAGDVLGERIEDYRPTVQDSQHAVPRSSELTFVPKVDGCQFNPPQQAIHWHESVHKTEFRFCSDPSLDGQYARGRMSIYLGAILLADVQLRFKVDSNLDEDRNPQPREQESASPFRKIFASYSHRDLSIVEQFESYAATLGDRYLRDWKDLRAGEDWNERLKEMIREADVFQLFWSSHSMYSEFVKQEWEFAVSLKEKGANFVRPTYWEQPLPEDRTQNLPPAELRTKHFTCLSEFSVASHHVHQKIEVSVWERKTEMWTGITKTPLEIGRQQAGDSGPLELQDLVSMQRLVIAPVTSSSIPRQTLLVESLTDRRLRVSNIHPQLSFFVNTSGETLGPGENFEAEDEIIVSLPDNRSVRVQSCVPDSVLSPSDEGATDTSSRSLPSQTRAPDSVLSSADGLQMDSTMGCFPGEVERGDSSTSSPPRSKYRKSGSNGILSRKIWWIIIFLLFLIAVLVFGDDILGQLWPSLFGDTIYSGPNELA